MYATDDHLTRAGEELGEPDALYRVSPGWFQTKLAIGLGLAVRTLSLSFSLQHESKG